MCEKKTSNVPSSPDPKVRRKGKTSSVLADVLGEAIGPVVETLIEIVTDN